MRGGILLFFAIAAPFRNKEAFMSNTEMEIGASDGNRGLSNPDAWPWPNSLDALVAAPEYHHVLLENERVRVLDVLIPQGHTVPVHTHRWPAVLVLVNDGDFVRCDAGGAVLFDTRTTAKRLPLVPTWSEPFPPHSVENVGNTDIHVISIELKD